MKTEDAKEKYEQLFQDEKSKAAAFDKIAERYYYSNFGSTNKSDLDVLMFSLYLDRILDISENDDSAYSDYTLSKQLGIPQSKVSALKVKKELVYPYDGFKWQESLLRISDRAVFEDGKIKLMIPDKNLYLEIKNAIETAGGFVEVQLTSSLLQIRLEYFLDLLLSLSEKKCRETLRKEIKEKTSLGKEDVEYLEKEPLGKALMGKAPELLVSIIGDCVPLFGDTAGKIAGILLEIIQRSLATSKKQKAPKNIKEKQ